MNLLCKLGFHKFKIVNKKIAMFSHYVLGKRVADMKGVIYLEECEREKCKERKAYVIYSDMERRDYNPDLF